MKEASGELNMTLVTIVAVAAIGGLIYAFLPTIKNVINKQWNKVGNQQVCKDWDTTTGVCKSWS